MQALKQFLRPLASLKLSVACLVLLSILVFWGTIDQVENGLYLAQEKFFNSFAIFLGPIPIPSARTVIWVLAFNLIAAFFVRFTFKWKKTGIILSHLGFLVLLISGFTTINFNEESYINLKEGEQKNYSYDYMKWELSLVKLGAKKDQRIVFPDKAIKTGAILKSEAFPGEIKIVKRFTNSQLFHTPFAGDIIKEMELEKDFEKNVGALFLELKTPEKLIKLELQGDSQNTQNFKIAQEEYFISFKKKRYELPFSVQLVDVNRELHPGTQKAKSYFSKVVVSDSQSQRDAKISMNQPLRKGFYTAYQASYGIDSDGEEFTVLALVKNIQYTLPYIGSIVMSLGLMLHFAMMFFNFYRRETN